MEFPQILNPVMRTLGATDPVRTAGFYRDVLGFSITGNGGATEATCGPARIRFGDSDYSPNDWDTPRTTGTAALFFQVENLTALHDSLRERNAKPSEIALVNWIKLRMFEIRDPDGHVLWFAQSYAEPGQPTPRPMMEKALPELPFANVPAAIAYYRDILGFHINYQQHNLGVMDRDAITILLIERTEEHQGIGSFEVYIENADQLYAELEVKGANTQGPPVSRPWGLRDFTIRDLEGNRITFAQPFE